MDRPKLGGTRRLVLACVNSWKGFVGAFRYEAAFRQEVSLAIILLPLGVWLGKTGIERALLVGSVLVVLIVELLNTGIETVVDRIGLERHELSGLAKERRILRRTVILGPVRRHLGLPPIRLTETEPCIPCRL